MKPSTAVSEGDPALLRGYKYYMLYCIAIFGSAWIYVSAAHVLLTEKADGVSLVSVAILLCVSASWLAYGLMLGHLPIAISGLVSIMGNMLLLSSVFWVRQLQH